MNTELLLKVRDRILAEPEHFDMTLYFRDGPCGTTACIAGWACALARESTLEETCVSIYGNQLTAAKEGKAVLELTFEHAQLLFYVSRWPASYSRRYSGAKPKRWAQVAADRIDHFIATNGAE